MKLHIERYGPILSSRDSSWKGRVLLLFDLSRDQLLFKSYNIDFILTKIIRMTENRGATKTLIPIPIKIIVIISCPGGKGSIINLLK